MNPGLKYAREVLLGTIAGGLSGESERTDREAARDITEAIELFIEAKLRAIHEVEEEGD